MLTFSWHMALKKGIVQFFANFLLIVKIFHRHRTSEYLIVLVGEGQGLKKGLIGFLIVGPRPLSGISTLRAFKGFGSEANSTVALLLVLSAEYWSMKHSAASNTMTICVLGNLSAHLSQKDWELTSFTATATKKLSSDECLLAKI